MGGGPMKEKSRLTIDMTPDEHMYLKLAATKKGVTMREFVLSATLKEIDELEDQILGERADKIWEDIKSGKEKTIPWEEMKKEIM